VAFSTGVEGAITTTHKYSKNRLSCVALRQAPCVVKVSAIMMHQKMRQSIKRVCSVSKFLEGFLQRTDEPFFLPFFFAKTTEHWPYTSRATIISILLVIAPPAIAFNAPTALSQPLPSHGRLHAHAASRCAGPTATLGYYPPSNRSRRPSSVGQLNGQRSWAGERAKATRRPAG
jgi:hypothetical protein